MRLAVELLKVGTATHPGHQRRVNEDRIWADAGRGIFLVVDGMGGHAAGQVAAETAREAIEESLEVAWVDSEVAIRRAIVRANDRVMAAGQSRPEWQGMACVLTLAIVEDGRLSWGHVGDSRLYLLRDGVLRKLTPDHSPVGEQEDRGEIDERAAMEHPCRHQVFRNVGSARREMDDAQFMDTGSVEFLPASAVLLCSDGLSDALTVAEMKAIIGRFDGNAEQVAAELVEVANERRGLDNVSVIFVPGAEFQGAAAGSRAGINGRHAETRVRAGRRWTPPAGRLVWLLVGILMGALLAAAWAHREEISAGWPGTKAAGTNR